MRVGLRHLREHKFRPSFQDTLNPICNCSKDIATTSHYLLYCPHYLHERKTLLNTVSCIVSNTFDFNNDQLTEILLYGKENLDNINNTSILGVTITYLIETKRFNAEHFWWTLDVMALTLMLPLKSKFVFIFFLWFVFSIFIFLLIFVVFFNILYVYFFGPRYMTTCICMHGDCKFFCLNCKCWYRKKN